MNFNRKRAGILAAVPVTALVLGVAACTNSGNNGNNTEHQQQLNDTTTLENNQPLPHFNYSQARQNMIDIETAEANNVQTTSFFVNLGVADPIGSCPSIGFGIPDSASLSNPDQVVGAPNSQAAVIGQQDPPGLYAPASSMGTFVICLTATGQPYINRIESTVNTYGGPAGWNYTKHEAELVGAPTAAAKLSPPTNAENKSTGK
jgi:hypothetical protein